MLDPDLPALPVLPDPGEALRTFLLRCTGIREIAETRIGITLTGASPAIRYSLLGGPAGYDEGQPLLQLECWGGSSSDDGTAVDLALAVVAAVPQMHGSYAGGWVAGAAVESGPFSSPDQKTGRARVIVTVRLFTYALEAST